MDQGTQPMGRGNRRRYRLLVTGHIHKQRHQQDDPDGPTNAIHKICGMSKMVVNKGTRRDMRMTGGEAMGVTAHSIESTLLSWSINNVPEDLRMLQEHHRISSDDSRQN